MGALAVVARRRSQRGQAIAEAAIILPALLLFSLAVLQAGFLGYAAVIARHAAFRGARAAVVATPRERAGAGRTAALLAAARAPGLMPVSVSVRSLARSRDLPFPVVEARVTVLSPRLVWGFGPPIARGACRLPVEPAWTTAVPSR